jgi:hypothetical protein
MMHDAPEHARRRWRDTLLAMRSILLVGAAALVLAGCATQSEPADPGQRFPDVVTVETTPGPKGVTFDVTISSPYDSPERYADAIRVRSADGRAVYGMRELAHDHAAEQPFTRGVPDVALPEVVTEVVIEARDSENGWGGGTQSVSFTPGG